MVGRTSRERSVDGILNQKQHVRVAGRAWSVFPTFAETTTSCPGVRTSASEARPGEARPPRGSALAVRRRPSAAVRTTL